MKKFAVLLIILFFYGCAEKNEGTSGFRVGVSSHAINPNMGAFIAGDQNNRQFTSVHDSLYVKAVLVSFNFRRANCEYVGQFAQILKENMDWLRENGHPKWKFVDLEFPLKGWEQYDCVKKYLARIPKAAPKPLSMLTTVMPPAQELSMPSSAASP